MASVKWIVTHWRIVYRSDRPTRWSVPIIIELYPRGSCFLGNIKSQRKAWVGSFCPAGHRLSYIECVYIIQYDLVIMCSVLLLSWRNFESPFLAFFMFK